MIQARMFGCQTTTFSGFGLFEADKYLVENADELTEGWKKAYPGVNVEAEIPKAHAWQLAHPSRRKKSQAKFLNNWMKRATEKDSWNVSAEDTATALREAMG